MGILQAGWFTADNAPNNDSCMKYIGREIDPRKLRWDPSECRIRFVSFHFNDIHLIIYFAAVWNIPCTLVPRSSSKVWRQPQDVLFSKKSKNMTHPILTKTTRTFPTETVGMMRMRRMMTLMWEMHVAKPLLSSSR